MPRVLDERLELNLIAEDPEIVTPIGIAIDSLERIFVLESHTHLPPNDYPGPKGDKIKIFADQDGDGHPERISVFAEGFIEGVNIAFSPEGQLYVVTSSAVYALYDRDKDGVSEEQVKVVELTEPEEVYAHAALLGITFSPDGWMYLSRGNTGSSHWKMEGTDGSSLSGYGDGGNIVRARADGSNLQEVATGFWNAMDLKFDERGRLFAIDNDPDSRGPNRLVHVVPGGDYGYRSLYGGSGIHPYLAWNGELPGTLPYAVGLGEAPSGLADASLAALPKDYQGQMLATIWEESRIVRIQLVPKGISVTGHTEVIVEGNQEFRPVALATSLNGTIYFTDWVLRDYPNHGRGRIWKLAARPDVEVATPRRQYAPPLPNPEGEAMHKIYAASPANQMEMFKGALKSDDPFLRHAATTTLAQVLYQPELVKATHDPAADIRLGSLLALQHSGYDQAEPILRRLLDDPDARVRQRVLIWIGQEGMTALLPDLEKALKVGTPSPALFETYLETIRHLMPDFIHSYQNKSEPYSRSIKRPLPGRFLENFIQNKSQPAALRALAIRKLENPGEQRELLASLLAKGQDPKLRMEAVQTLANVPGLEIAEQLCGIAADPSNPALIRAEALLSLSRQPGNKSEKIIPLLQDAEPDVQIEAARYLRTKLAAKEIRQVFEAKKDLVQPSTGDALQEQFALALTPESGDKKPSGRPSAPREWEEVLATGGDAQRGRRVFYSIQSACSSCHAVEGRGGDLGPDLSNIGLSKSRSQLVAAILNPSQEISPEYQGWYIKLKNGEMHQGRQIDVGDRDIKLYTPLGKFNTYPKKEVQNYGMTESSLMPDGLEAGLTVSDLQDLISFLERNK